MLWLRKSDFDAHVEQDKRDFAANRKEFRNARKAFSKHDEYVRGRHEENKATMIGIQSQFATLQTSVQEILKLKPDIENGIKADQERLRRQTRWRTAFTTGVAVLVAISGLVPLFLWLSSLKITVHSG